MNRKLIIAVNVLNDDDKRNNMINLILSDLADE